MPVIELKSEPSVALFELMLRWLYSASVEIPQNIFEVCQLFFIAHRYQVLDLLSRCEHEIINKIDSLNVVDLLVMLHPAKQLTPSDAGGLTEEEQRDLISQIMAQARQLVSAGVVSLPVQAASSDAPDAQEESKGAPDGPIWQKSPVHV